jgi:hypothetical protein
MQPLIHPEAASFSFSSGRSLSYLFSARLLVRRRPRARPPLQLPRRAPGIKGCRGRRTRLP